MSSFKDTGGAQQSPVGNPQKILESTISLQPHPDTAIINTEGGTLASEEHAGRTRPNPVSWDLGDEQGSPSQTHPFVTPATTATKLSHRRKEPTAVTGLR